MGWKKEAGCGMFLFVNIVIKVFFVNGNSILSLEPLEFVTYLNG